MEQERDNLAAETVLSIAMDYVRDAMRPWTVEDQHLEYLKGQFREDFYNLFGVDKPDSYIFWADPIKRLFTSVGTAVALIAESEELGTRQKPGTVSLHELKLASKLVEVAICPRFVNENPNAKRACRRAKFLEDMEATLVDLVKERYRRYKELPRR